MLKLMILLSTALCIMMFQNCQKAGFTSSDDPFAKSSGELTPVVTVDESEGPLSQLPPAPPVLRLPEQEQIIDPNGSGNLVCILEGPGNSVKLGMSIEGNLRGQNKIPQVLCMSEVACLEIAARVFDVKGPEQRGYCNDPGGNPHVSHIANAELEVKVQALEAL